MSVAVASQEKVQVITQVAELPYFSGVLFRLLNYQINVSASFFSCTNTPGL